MILTCGTCHRVKIDAKWEQYGGVEADAVGICPTCLGWQTRVAAAKGREQDRKLLRDRECGYPEADAGEDVFRGFRRLE